MGWLGKNVPGVVALAGAAVLLAGCVTQGAFATAEKLDRRAADLNVVLMPPDIVLFEFTVGGVREPNALWTDSAKSHAEDTLKALLEQRNTQLVAYKEPDDAESNHLHDQVIKLHATVGNAILVHQYFQPLVLPSKKDKFEWTLGGGES